MTALFKKPANPDSIIITFLTLRRLVGIFGIALPFVLILGSFILDKPVTVQSSLSVYYYTSMRNVLVGVLCAVAVFLFSYHGYEWKDSLASKIAGLFALGIAFLPTIVLPTGADLNKRQALINGLHFASAAIFFVTLSYMSLFLFTKSKGHKTKNKSRRNRIYRICGIIMLISVAGIPVVKIKTVQEKISFIKPTLILETSALVAFGISWLTKGEMILSDES